MSIKSEIRKRKKAELAAAQAKRRKGRIPHADGTTATQKPFRMGPQKNGRPLKDFVLVEEARANTREALEVALEIMRNSADPQTRLAAVKFVTERGYGKPKQEMDLQVSTVAPREPVVCLTDDEVMAEYMRMMSNPNHPGLDMSRVPPRKPKPPALEAPVVPLALVPKAVAPPPADPMDGSIVAIVPESIAEMDARLRNQHEHRPMPDSNCPRCRALWVAQ